MSEKNQPSMRESVNTSLEVIAEEPVLQALLNTIPGVGSSLNELLAGKGQRIMEKRRDNLLLLLGKHLEVLDKDAIKKDYFETDEGFDLLIKALDESRKTRSEEKRDLIARILAGAASTDSETGEYSPEEYLNPVATLTVKELAVARTIYRLQKGQDYRELDPDDRGKSWAKSREKIVEEHALNVNELPLLLDRIASTGLIELVYLLTPGSPARTYWVSPAFHKLMEFLRLET
jgi:hypothetical protein